MEEKMGHPFFCCDAVLDTYSRQIAIYSGYAKEMMPISWKLADKRTYVHWAEKKYDVLVFGMPQKFHYGDGMGTNPIMMMQALSAQVLRFKRIMSDNCVIICSSACNGYFHDELWPYLREQYEMFQHDYMNTLADMNRYGEYFATNEEYIRKYRFCNAFHILWVFPHIHRWLFHAVQTEYSFLLCTLHPPSHQTESDTSRHSM